MLRDAGNGSLEWTTNVNQSIKRQPGFKTPNKVQFEAFLSH